jgi:hypothetical protein
VNLNHFDCLSPPAFQHEFAGLTSCEPKPALDVGCEKLFALHKVAALLQSWPATVGGDELVTQTWNGPGVALLTFEIVK